MSQSLQTMIEAFIEKRKKLEKPDTNALSTATKPAVTGSCAAPEAASAELYKEQHNVRAIASSLWIGI